MLIAYGAKLTKKNSSGYTPLYYSTPLMTAELGLSDYFIHTGLKKENPSEKMRHRSKYQTNLSKDENESLSLRNLLNTGSKSMEISLQNENEKNQKSQSSKKRKTQMFNMDRNKIYNI